MALVRSGANGYCPTERANVKSQLGAVIRERHLLPRFRAKEPAKIVLADERETSTAKAGGDPAALRGLPAIGVRGGFGGAVRGSKPGSNL